jgi:hypothetical protein
MSRHLVPSIKAPNPAPRALSHWAQVRYPKRAGAMVWQNQNQGHQTGAKLSPATKGLGVAGTLGPEGQAAFSYGRPLSATPTALADKGGGGAWYNGHQFKLSRANNTYLFNCRVNPTNKG